MVRMAKKVQISCWIDPSTKALLEEQAKIEKREPGNLSALLVEWASAQLKNAGNSLTLMDWEAGPKKDVKGGRKAG